MLSSTPTLGIIGPDAARLRHRGAEGAVHPGMISGRRALGAVPLRAHRWLRPRRRGDPGDARRRRVHPQRLEDLEHRAPTTPTTASAWPAPTGTCPSTAASRCSIVPIAPARARGDPDPTGHRRRRVLPGVLRRRRRPRDRRRRRGQRRLEGGVAAALARAQRDRRGLGVPRHGHRRRQARRRELGGRVATSPNSPAARGLADDSHSRQLVAEAHVLATVNRQLSSRLQTAHDPRRAPARGRVAPEAVRVDRGRPHVRHHDGARRLLGGGVAGRRSIRGPRRRATSSARPRRSSAAPARSNATSSASGCSGFRASRHRTVTCRSATCATTGCPTATLRTAPAAEVGLSNVSGAPAGPVVVDLAHGRDRRTDLDAVASSSPTLPWPSATPRPRRPEPRPNRCRCTSNERRAARSTGSATTSSCCCEWRTSSRSTSTTTSSRRRSTSGAAGRPSPLVSTAPSTGSIGACSTLSSPPSASPRSPPTCAHSPDEMIEAFVDDGEVRGLDARCYLARHADDRRRLVADPSKS